MLLPSRCCCGWHWGDPTPTLRGLGSYWHTRLSNRRPLWRSRGCSKPPINYANKDEHQGDNKNSNPHRNFLSHTLPPSFLTGCKESLNALPDAANFANRNLGWSAQSHRGK